MATPLVSLERCETTGKWKPSESVPVDAKAPVVSLAEQIESHNQAVTDLLESQRTNHGKPFASSLEAWGLPKDQVQPDPVTISPERKEEIKKQIKWSFKCSVWEIVFCGEPEGDYTAGGDITYDWPEIEVNYLVNNCHHQAQKFLCKWNALSDEKKKELKAECVKICGGVAENWWEVNNDQIAKCSEFVLAAMAKPVV